MHQECDDLLIATNESRAQTKQPSPIPSVSTGLLDRIAVCGYLLMLKSQLIDNETSMLAECYMSIKCQSGSYETQCLAARMRMLDGLT